MIYITGDVHREQDIHKINPREFEAGNHLTPDDYVIICGDFGCIWDGADGDRFWLNWLESLPWNTLFLDGNHENFDLLNNKFETVEYHGGKAHKIRSNIYHLKRGEVYDIDGKSFFTFGGAFSHDVKYRTEHVNWWKDELPTRKECENGFRNLAARDWKVDYILTHDVYGGHPLAGRYVTDMKPYDKDKVNIHQYLEEIARKTGYKVWFTGHYHGDWKYIREGKPCVTLFEHVFLLDDLDNQLTEIEPLKEHESTR